MENGRRTSFVYHNGELLREEGGNEKQSSYHLGAGIDALQRGKELSYYHRDEQLSTAFITDSRGVIQSSYQYDAFGTGLESVEQLSNRICYTGQQYDRLTGQYYLRARYYNSVLGRFMQEDVYQGDGLNLYAYCDNNPVMYFDPSGYMKQKDPDYEPNGNISEGMGDTEPDTEGDSNTNIPWSSREVSDAAKQLQDGAKSVTVKIRSQAAELFLGLYQGDGYINVTGMDAMDVINLLGAFL